MPISERLTRASEQTSWVDAIPLRYEYTAGVAGESFLRGLAEGKILSARCSRCERSALPPRVYCVRCYSRTSAFVEVRSVGTVTAITRAVTPTGEKVAFGFVEFPGVDGGMVHRILPGARAGTSVEPVFRPRRERVGAISDILGFRRRRSRP